MKRFTITNVSDLHFGRHVGRNFDDLGAPFVVVHGANESGKTTLAEFLTWVIGGPWRTAAENSSIFHVAGKDHVHGRLAADLDSTAVDIDAKFKILKKDRPNDLRTGTFGSQILDAASIGKFFSDLSPTDYQLMYRLYGGSLGDIGSANTFSDLFTSFAMGSSSGTGNPRGSLVSLQQRLTGLKKPLDDLGRARKSVESAIKEASKAPDDIARTEGQIAELTRTIDDLGLQRDALTGERALVRRASEGLVHIHKRTQAQDALSHIGRLDENWQQVADAAEAIGKVASDFESLNVQENEAQQKAQTSVVSCGMSEDELRGRSLTPPERQHLDSLVSDLVGAKDAGNILIGEKESLESQLLNQEDAAIARQAELDLTDEQIAFLDTHDVMLLTDRASRWGEAIATVISKRETLASEKKRIEQARSVGTSGESTANKSFPRAAIAAGFVAVSLLALWQSAAAIVAGVLLAVMSFVLVGKNPRSSTRAKDASSESSGVNAIEQSLAEAEEAAESHRTYLHEAAGPLVSLLTHPDMARGVIQSLGEFSQMRKDIRSLIQAIEQHEQQISDAQSKEESAEVAVVGIFADRRIPASFANSEFSKWLALYEVAVGDVAAYDIARAALQQARETFASLVSPIEREIEGLDIAVVLSRVQETAKTLGEIRAAERALRDAEIQVNAAQMDSAEVVAILEMYAHEEALKSRYESLNNQINEIITSRDDAITARGALQTELDVKSGAEVLPGLHLEKGEIDEQIEAIERQKKVLESATSILSEVMERYENENQDPVVVAASELVAQVVPNWGSIRFSRSDDGKSTPILERSSPTGRLNDKFISDGGRALMYLALRIAFAQKDAARRGIALPLICDDPLVHFDDQRSESAIALLAQVSTEHQVLLFTCERRTRDIAASLGARVIEI